MTQPASPQDSGRPESLADYLPTEAEQHAYALEEHRAVVAAEIKHHLSNMESEIRRHREALEHFDNVFSLRLTGATREHPGGTAREGTPTS